MNSTLADRLHDALIDEVYDGGSGALTDDQFTALVRKLAETAAAVFEKAHTPTGDEHAARYDGSIRCADCGGVMGLEGRGGDSERWVHLAAAFRRSEVPEPSAEGWSTEDRRNAEAEAKHRWHVEESRTRTSQRDFDNFNQGCINGFMLGAEWWKSTHAVTDQQGEPSDAERYALARLQARIHEEHMPHLHLGQCKCGASLGDSIDWSWPLTGVALRAASEIGGEGR